MTSSAPIPHNDAKGGARSYILVVLLLLGFYIPTSIGGVQSSGLVALSIPLLLMGILSLLLINGMGNYWLRCIGCSIPAVLFLSSLISPFPFTEVGSLYLYSLLGLLYMVKLNIPEANCYRVLSKGLFPVNIISMVLGIGIIFQSSSVSNFLIDHYTYFYPELLPAMFALRKPVLTFGTHSVAGFFLFLLFWMNLRTYEKRRQISSLCFAIAFTVFSLILFSFTSLFFFVWEIVLLAWLALQRSWKKALVGMFLLGSAAIAASSVWIDKDLRSSLADYAVGYLQSQENGLLGRYSHSGDLVDDLRFLQNHPWRPVGVTGSKHLIFVDSGPVEYILRGSLPLVLLIYSGLVAFMGSNLNDKKDVRVSIIAFIAFEVGFAILPFPRTLFFIPFFVAYLNALQNPSVQTELPSTNQSRNLWAPMGTPSLTQARFES